MNRQIEQVSGKNNNIIVTFILVMLTKFVYYFIMLPLQFRTPFKYNFFYYFSSIVAFILTREKVNTRFTMTIHRKVNLLRKIKQIN